MNKNEIEAKYVEEFRNNPKNQKKKIINEYWIPDSWKCKDLMTIFTGHSAPDDFVNKARELAEYAKEHNAEITRYGGYIPYKNNVARNGLCFKTSREETDEEFKERIEREEKWFVRDKMEKWRNGKKKHKMDRIKEKLTKEELKFLNF